MFIGHYSASFAAKIVAPKTPLWVLVAGAQLVDIAWCGAIMTGLEVVRTDPSAPGSGLDFVFYPYTHSLAAGVAWALLAWAFARFVLKLGGWGSLMTALVVLSHWFLDLLVHAPDLPLWPGSPKFGYGLWDAPRLELVVETGLVAVAGAAWVAARKNDGRRGWPAVLFIGVLFAVEAANVASPPPANIDPFGLGIMGLVAYGLLTLLAWVVDRPRRSLEP